MPISLRILVAVVATVVVLGCRSQPRAQDDRPSWAGASISKMEKELVARYGEAERARLQRGLKQAAAFWRPEDGDDQDRRRDRRDASIVHGRRRRESPLRDRFDHEIKIGRRHANAFDLRHGAF